MIGGIGVVAMKADCDRSPRSVSCIVTDGIERQEVASACERDAVVAGMKNRFVGDDLELAAAGDGGDRGGRLAGIGKCAAAGDEFLRIAALVLREPRGRLDERKMRVDGR